MRFGLSSNKKAKQSTQDETAKEFFHKRRMERAAGIFPMQRTQKPHGSPLYQEESAVTKSSRTVNALKSMDYLRITRSVAPLAPLSSPRLQASSSNTPPASHRELSTSSSNPMKRPLASHDYQRCILFFVQRLLLCYYIYYLCYGGTVLMEKKPTLSIRNDQRKQYSIPS